MIRHTAWGRLKHDITNRGVSAWLLSAVLTASYLWLYYRAQSESKWTVYGLLYTLAVTGGGVYVLRRYRKNRYQVIRTLVVMFSQAVLAFAVPLLLRRAGQPEYYVSYWWPLKFEYLTPAFLSSLPVHWVVYSVAGSLLLVPLLGVLFGKRWYCSWVCGCGGLANTFGEPWRHLSVKTGASWRLEKVTVHAVLALSVALTLALFAHAWWGAPGGALADRWQHWYSVIVSTWLAGIIGVGLYPLGGTRVWCRFFCPMAALLGLVQKAGRFRIAVKPDMCISCGLCTKYCEMGIDVRGYAQANRSFTRASCVGCGLCAEVCPRGVLRLDNARPAEPLVQIRGIAPASG